MADLKISELTNLTAADPANDMIPIVDVSATPPASGSTKRISINNILACSPTATLASATITGDLTVDTNTLKVDSTNNRVGVNTASPATDLEVRANGNAEGTIRLYSAIDGSTASPKGSYFSFRSGTGSGTETARLSSLNRFANVLGGDFSISTADTSSVLQNRLTIDSGGVFTFAVGGSTAMILNSTGLGVGGSPVSGMLLTVGSTSSVSATANAFQILSNKGTFNIVTNGATNAAGTTITYSWANDGQGPLIFRNAAVSNVMTLDASGNVGIGVTPSAWGGAYVKALQMNGGGSLVNNQSNDLHLGTNCYHNGTNWVYVSTNTASRYEQFNGGHYWLSAPSGTAGNAITGANEFVAKMQIDTSGNFIILPTNTPPTLSTNGQISINATSNTNLRFRYRGSDGVTRTADITLA